MTSGAGSASATSSSKLISSVSVCGSAPADPCHQYADQSFFIDYSDRDAVLALVEAEQFDYLVPTCNDFSYMSCAWVAERCGFAGFDRYPVATILHTKNAFREVMERHGLRSPPSRRLAANATVDSVKARISKLTTRERQIMELVVAGKFNKVIADELNISMRTVEVHRANLFDKMRVKTAVELANLLKPKP